MLVEILWSNATNECWKLGNICDFFFQNLMKKFDSTLFAHFFAVKFFFIVFSKKKPLHLSRPNPRIYFANNFVGAAFKVMELY